MLTLIPVSLAQANEFVRQHHRHHKPVADTSFPLAVLKMGGFVPLPLWDGL